MSDEAKILDQNVNDAVVHLPGRQFPGLVVQGDTFKSLQEVASEILEALARGAAEDAREAAEYLLDKLNARVSYYEGVLQREGVGLPYRRSS